MIKPDVLISCKHELARAEEPNINTLKGRVILNVEKTRSSQRRFKIRAGRQ